MELPEFLSSDDGGFIHITGHRIGLHHVLRLYCAGHSPEMIVATYPTLSLSLVHKAIAFYLDHTMEIDAYVVDHDRIMHEQAASAQSGPTIAELRRRSDARHKAQAQPSESA